MAQTVKWWSGFLSGAPSFDRDVAALMWSLILWGVASWAGWRFRRTRQVLISLLPAGVVIASSLSYSRGSSFFLIPLTAGVFSLLAWNYFNEQQLRWVGSQTDVAEDIRFDMIAWVAAVCSVILLLSLAISTISPQKIFRTAREFTARRGNESQEVGAALGLENPSEERSNAPAADPGILPQSHLLSAGPELSKKIALIIQVQQKDIRTPTSQPPTPTPVLYWRALTYDVYTGRGWMTSPTVSAKYQAGEMVTPAPLASQWLISQTVEMLSQPGKTIYAAGMIMKSDRPVQVEWRETQEPFQDLFAAVLQRESRERTYRVDSWVTLTGESQLRQSSDDYPQWIIQRYLQLPINFPDSVRQLALELTQTVPSPYDKARAIEAYLRRFPYSLDIPEPPATGDVSEYFLFDLKTGYCDYYATTMVVLARAAGIPSRLVVGYASGLYDKPLQRYIVTEADAHSWAEIYFPDIGWVEFEPTANRETISQPPDLSPTDLLGQNLPPPMGDDFPRYVDWRWLIGLIAGLGLIIISASIWIATDTWRLKHLQPSQTVIVLYQRLYRQVINLGVPARINYTPNEFMQATSQKFGQLNQQKGLSRFFSDSSKIANLLVAEYNRASYSPFPVDQALQMRLIRAWKSLRNRLWLARVWLTARNLFSGG